MNKENHVYYYLCSEVEVRFGFSIRPWNPLFEILRLAIKQSASTFLNAMFLVFKIHLSEKILYLCQFTILKGRNYSCKCT